MLYFTMDRKGMIKELKDLGIWNITKKDSNSLLRSLLVIRRNQERQKRGIK